MANKIFLEEYPLYRKFKTNSKDTTWTKHFPGSLPTSGTTRVALNTIPKPAINLFCKKCSSEQTFNMVGDYYPNPSVIPQADNRFSEVVYRCEGCKVVLQRYYLHFFNDELISVDPKSGDEIRETWLFVRKVGQFPAWNISVNQELEELLGEHADYYKKGLVNESQSYGIGAYAYFRRITEEVIDGLLDSISDLLVGDDKLKYEQALLLTKKSRTTQEKIDLVKDLLPTSLCPDGINPLGVLHSALSEGLHGEDDETCLEHADAIKKVLIFLLNETLKRKEGSRVFTEGMKKLLDKKAKKVVLSEENNDA